jgi:hypothetical protein
VRGQGANRRQGSVILGFPEEGLRNSTSVLELPNRKAIRLAEDAAAISSAFGEEGPLTCGTQMDPDLSLRRRR